MQLPARIGKYELQEFLGGGMSRVYRAGHGHRPTVAVKILTEAGCADPEAKDAFSAEARMAGNITHDNIISIYDFGEDEQPAVHGDGVSARPGPAARHPERALPATFRAS